MNPLILEDKLYFKILSPAYCWNWKYTGFKTLVDKMNYESKGERDQRLIKEVLKAIR